MVHIQHFKWVPPVVELSIVLVETKWSSSKTSIQLKKGPGVTDVFFYFTR